jgi:hypothetical protein
LVLAVVLELVEVVALEVIQVSIRQQLHYGQPEAVVEVRQIRDQAEALVVPVVAVQE